MTAKDRKRLELLNQADDLLNQALRLGGHHPCLGESVVMAQSHIDDAVTWNDRQQTLLKKRS